jgi:hypothetical protein
MTARLRRSALSIALLGSTTTTALEAQRVAPVLDVGASTVRYADSVSVSAATLTPTLRVESSNATVAVTATFSQIASGGWTTQGAIAVSRFVPLGGRFHAELAASGGGSAHQDETHTGQLLIQGRAHLMGRARGIWLGGGAGSTWDGAAARALTLLDAGAWLSTGSATVLAAVAPTSISAVGGPSLRYADATAAARWVGARAEVATSVGARLGDGLPATGAGSSTWGSVSAALWVAGPVALTASAGTYPVDYTQGYPGGRFASLALRLAARSTSKGTSAAADTSLAATRDLAAPIGPVAAFSVGRSADRRHRTIALHAGTVTSVEVAGDFTRWQPVRLTRQRDGRWTATLPIRPGTHEIAVRVDGGPWMAPPGLTTIRDEFGGTSGLLVIRE